MKGTGITLIVVGVAGAAVSLMMVGDIGISGLIGSATAFISGIGFFRMNKNKTAH